MTIRELLKKADPKEEKRVSDTMPLIMAIHDAMYLEMLIAKEYGKYVRIKPDTTIEKLKLIINDK